MRGPQTRGRERRLPAHQPEVLRLGPLRPVRPVGLPGPMRPGKPSRQNPRPHRRTRRRGGRRVSNQRPKSPDARRVKSRQAPVPLPRSEVVEPRTKSSCPVLRGTHPGRLAGVGPVRPPSSDFRSSDLDRNTSPSLCGSVLGALSSFGQRTRIDSTLSGASADLLNVSPHCFLKLDFRMQKLARELDSRIRISNYQLDVHRRNVASTFRLDPGSWPRDREINRPLWPSSPTLSEWMEMTRRGASPCDLGRPVGKTVRVSRSFQMYDILLTKRICSRHIIGVRSDVSVPEQFLGHFRYRQGFLILTSPYSLPSGLARFLVSQWVTDPHSLWLEWFGTLKQYLRRVPSHLLDGIELKAPHELLVEELDDDE
jgi:hypothetical protein